MAISGGSGGSATAGRQAVILAISFTFLAGLLAVVGVWQVPSHWTSIWMDREFTGWIAPIANRLGGGTHLYEHGLHLPMPPLPFVVMRLLYPGGARWIDESLLNYLCQAGLILVLFLAFARRLGTGLALATALAAVPVILALPKTILYDGMAQLLLACLAVTAAEVVTRARAARGLSAPLWLVAPVLLGSIQALLVLSKHSTGAGGGLGVAFLLLFFPYARLRDRLGFTAAFGLASGLMFVVFAMAMQRYVNLDGLITDVFITGSEPKGGPGRLYASLFKYIGELGILALGTYLFALVYQFCFSGRAPVLLLPERWTDPDELPLIPTVLAASVVGLGVCLYTATNRPGSTAPFLQASRVILAAGAASSIAVVLHLAYQRVKGKPQGPLEHPLGWPALMFLAFSICYVADVTWLMDAFRIWGGDLMITGLMLTLCGIGATLVPRRTGRLEALLDHPLTPYGCVLVAGALFHSLSVFYLRWTYDNNPVILCALGFLFSAVARAPDRVPGPLRLRRLSAGLIGVTIVMCWAFGVEQAWAISRCTESWPEIPYLAGARLRPEGGSMRALVKLIHQLPFKPDETVLLLPNDPNVEAWIDRPRPAVAGAILFTDQYWDRYVDGDFAELQLHPPRVIVIGPRYYWRSFSTAWRAGIGVERLIDRVRTELIPHHYTLYKQQAIMFQGRTDYMDVYVR